MADHGDIQVVLERHPVTLHYPGSEGAGFQDVVLVLSTPGGEPVPEMGLQLNVRQGEASLMDGPADLVALGVGTSIPVGEA